MSFSAQSEEACSAGSTFLQLLKDFNETVVLDAHYLALSFRKLGLRCREKDFAKR